MELQAVDFTKDDLLRLYKKLEDVSQELTDYSGDADNTGNLNLRDDLDNAISSVGAAMGEVEQCMKHLK